MLLLKSLVLPHPLHKKRSFLLQHKALLGYIIFIIILLGISWKLTRDMPGVLGYAENIKIPELLTYTNRMREERGINGLTLNAQLSKAAEAKANDMFNKGYWAHTSPDGKEPWDFIVASGYDYVYAGENLAVDFSDSENVVEAWYDSATHRENLLNAKYTDMGLAVVDGELEGRETTLVVQMFGYPRSKAAEVSGVEADTPNLAAVEEVVETNVVPSEAIAESAIVEESVPAPIVIEEISPVNPSRAGAVLNAAAVYNVSRYIAIILGIFVTAMFVIDGYYVRQMGIFRVSGHTILHIIMLIAAIAGIWYTQIGLVL